VLFTTSSGFNGKRKASCDANRCHANALAAIFVEACPQQKASYQRVRWLIPNIALQSGRHKFVSNEIAAPSFPLSLFLICRRARCALLTRGGCDRFFAV
jgi:hypothetical protein